MLLGTSGTLAPAREFAVKFFSSELFYNFFLPFILEYANGTIVLAKNAKNNSCYLLFLVIKGNLLGRLPQSQNTLFLNNK